MISFGFWLMLRKGIWVSRIDLIKISYSFYLNFVSNEKFSMLLILRTLYNCKIYGVIIARLAHHLQVPHIPPPFLQIQIVYVFVV